MENHNESTNSIIDYLKVKIGKGTKIYHFCNIYGNTIIGKNCTIASYTEIQGGVKIGNNCRVGSHTFLCSAVTLENDIFLGSHVVTTNDTFPIVKNQNYKQKKTLIKKGASIGSGVILLPGVKIGKNALIGAGSVVTHDVPPNEIWVGNPARFLKKNIT